jgi:hypothetical protein
MDLHERFEQFNGEYLKFNRIESPLHSRPDIAAFILLDRLLPGTGDIVMAAEHDEIFLAADTDKLNAVARDEDIITLIRCGVRYGDSDTLAMFV